MKIYQSTETDDDSFLYFDEKTNLAVVSEDGIYGAINQDGAIIIPLIYDYAMFFSNELLPVKKNNKWGYVDKNNTIIIPFEYDNTITFISENDELFMKNDSVLGWTGYFNDEKAIVCKNAKLGVIDKENKILVPFKYETITSYNDKYACVSLDNKKYGLIDFENNVIIPFKYDYLSLVGDFISFGNLSDNVIDDKNNLTDFLIQSEGKLVLHGLMNLQQEVIVPAISASVIVSYVNKNVMCYNYHRKEFFIYNSLNNNTIYADESLTDDAKVNFIRNLVDLPIIEEYI